MVRIFEPTLLSDRLEAGAGRTLVGQGQRHRKKSSARALFFMRHAED